MEHHSFCPDRCGGLVVLREALQAAGYTEENVSATIRSAKAKLPLLLSRTAATSPYNTLVRLFRLGMGVPLEVARLALHPMELDKLASDGIIFPADDGHVRATVALSPVLDNLLVAHDLEANLTGGPIFARQVLGVGPASLTLAAMTVRRQNERMLDLCCGGGIQGLLAARRASLGIGTDINPRAGDFVVLNTCLNGVANLEFREGHQYEPVHEERFDLVVANPPYVISPTSTYAYRDSGLPGDAFSEQVIRQVLTTLRRMATAP